MRRRGRPKRLLTRPSRQELRELRAALEAARTAGLPSDALRPAEGRLEVLQEEAKAAAERATALEELENAAEGEARLSSKLPLFWPWRRMSTKTLWRCS